MQRLVHTTQLGFIARWDCVHDWYALILDSDLLPIGQWPYIFFSLVSSTQTAAGHPNKFDTFFCDVFSIVYVWMDGGIHMLAQHAANRSEH